MSILIVPVISIDEVFKKVFRERGDDEHFKDFPGVRFFKKPVVH